MVWFLGVARVEGEKDCLEVGGWSLQSIKCSRLGRSRVGLRCVESINSLYIVGVSLAAFP
jgi:hypothetical protein